MAFRYTGNYVPAKTFKEVYPSINPPPNRQIISANFGKDNIDQVNLSVPCQIDKVGIASIIGLRPSMEDTLCAKRLNNGIDFFAVYDGHGGWQIAALLRDEFYKQFEKININQFTDRQYMKQIICSICYEFGENIFKLNECDSVGSTAIIALRYANHIYTINIGDSGAIIFDPVNIVFKTDSHKPYDSLETSRLEKGGARVFNGRVNGVLAVSRAFGDNSFNRSANTDYKYPGFNGVISNEPSINYFTFFDNKPYHMVLASDGLWDCFTNATNTNASQFNVPYLCKRISNTNDNNLNAVAYELVNSAYKTGIFDNISIIIVKL